MTQFNLKLGLFVHLICGLLLAEFFTYNRRAREWVLAEDSILQISSFGCIVMDILSLCSCHDELEEVCINTAS